MSSEAHAIHLVRMKKEPQTGRGLNKTSWPDLNLALSPLAQGSFLNVLSLGVHLAAQQCFPIIPIVSFIPVSRSHQV